MFPAPSRLLAPARLRLTLLSKAPAGRRETGQKRVTRAGRPRQPQRRAMCGRRGRAAFPGGETPLPSSLVFSPSSSLPSFAPGCKGRLVLTSGENAAYVCVGPRPSRHGLEPTSGSAPPAPTGFTLNHHQLWLALPPKYILNLSLAQALNQLLSDYSLAS